MAREEASIAAALGAPAWAFAHLATARVQTKTADGHENMLTRLHPDGDETAFARLAIAGKADRGERRLEQAGLDQCVGGGAGAVISAIFNTAMTGAANVRAALEVVGGVHDILNLDGQVAGAGHLAAVEADKAVSSHRSCGAGGCSLLGVVSSHLLLINSHLLLISGDLLLICSPLLLTKGGDLLGGLRGSERGNDQKSGGDREAEGVGEGVHGAAVALFWYL